MPVLRGELHPRAKLTAAQVRLIRAAYVPGKITMVALALRYGVTKQTISNVLTGQCWKELGGLTPPQGSSGARALSS